MIDGMNSDADVSTAPENTQVTAEPAPQQEAIGSDLDNKIAIPENQVESTKPDSDPVKEMKQSKIDELIVNAKKEAAEKTKRDLEKQYREAYIAQQQTAQSSSSSEAIRAELFKMMEQHQITQLGNEVDAKLAVAKLDNPNLDKIVQEIDLYGIASRNPQFIFALNSVDNIGDVLKQINDNPIKLPELENLARYNPVLAQKEFARISQSIKMNKLAKEHPIPNKPLSTIQPSVSIADNGSSTVSDLRRQSNLKA